MKNLCRFKITNFFSLLFCRVHKCYLLQAMELSDENVCLPKQLIFRFELPMIQRLFWPNIKKFLHF